MNFKTGSLILILSGFLLCRNAKGQDDKDSIKNSNWNVHFQNTIINQYHPSFHAKYSGQNSLNPISESTLSITGTLYIGVKLWRSAEVYFNPEISGGSGFSRTTGIAGFPNGEVYRVTSPAPRVYVARLYLKQIIALSDDYENTSDDLNQLQTKIPSSYFGIYAGKFSVLDYFDDNKYSKDPRTQFFNWALMGNGAWDYPANTSGYTYGVILELLKPNWALRYFAVMVPTKANESVMDTKILKSHAEALEWEHSYLLAEQKGKIRIFAYLNAARMGNYKEAIEWGKRNDTVPSFASNQRLGRKKYGGGLNIEHDITKNLGFFLRIGWNDGHNETWMFTEIERHASLGISLNGEIWNRKGDDMGIAQIVNGISKDHRSFLTAGGYGFIIGDGNLKYGQEKITEFYYSFKLKNNRIFLTPDYQFILNPAYNRDRGPVHAFGLRIHVEN